MLPQSNRLPSYTIRDVMCRGRRIVGNGFTLIIDVRIPSSQLERCGKDKSCRFAFVVSTKVDKRAIVRNRMRRVMSESIRHIIFTLPTSFDCVILGSKGLVGLPQVEVQMRISEALRKAQLLNTES